MEISKNRKLAERVRRLAEKRQHHEHIISTLLGDPVGTLLGDPVGTLIGDPV